jgi:hypothetical protein
MNQSNSFRTQIKYRYAEKESRLRASCASAKRGAGLRNEDKNRKGALPIAQQRLYAIKTAHSRGTLCNINLPQEKECGGE